MAIYRPQPQKINQPITVGETPMKIADRYYDSDSDVDAPILARWKDWFDEVTVREATKPPKSKRR